MKHYYALFSGGLDSALALLNIALQENNLRISPLFFDYGQKAAEKEKEAVSKLIPLLREFGKQNGVVIEDCRKYEIGGTGLFEWSKSSILEGREDFGEPDLENRNMILISIAISIIMSDRKRRKARSKKQGLVVGFKNEHYDTTREFAAGLTTVTKQESFGIEIITPLVKDDSIVKWHSLAKQIRAEGAESLLKYAWSCYYPTAEGLPCKKCPPCISRKRLSKELGTRTRMKSQE